MKKKEITAPQAEQQAYQRNKLVSTLLGIKHGDLSLYVPEGLAAAKAEPEVLGHFLAWGERNGKVRDAKVALPVLALRGLKKTDSDLAENAIAHMLLLSPRGLLQAYDFNKKLVKDGYPIPAGFRRLLEQGMKTYLEQRELHNKWFDAVTLQHRDSMKRLYRITHKKPSPRAQQILFDGVYPEKSVFTAVKKLRTMSPKEAAGTILEFNIPMDVAIGSVAKAKDKDIVLALLEKMTGNQVITNTKMLERLGVNTDPILKSAYNEALSRAAKDKKVETLKAGKAASMTTGKTAEKLQNLQQERLKALGSIEGDWLVLGDKSGSMSGAIEKAKELASLVAERVAGKVYLVFFDNGPTFFDVTGKTFDQIKQDTRRVTAGGGTSIGSGLDYILSRELPVNGIVVVSDGGENGSPRFATTYKKYVKDVGVEPTVYFLRVEGGDADSFSYAMQAEGLQMEILDLSAHSDYYSLPSVLPMLKTRRYQIIDEIMESPLLTISEVYKQKLYERGSQANVAD